MTRKIVRTDMADKAYVLPFGLRFAMACYHVRGGGVLQAG